MASLWSMWRRPMTYERLQRSMWYGFFSSRPRGLRTKLVKRYLEDGGDVNRLGRGGWTLLHHAAEDGEPEAVRLLIGAGARIDAQEEMGYTALHLAVDVECDSSWFEPGQRREFVVTGLLIELGADESIRSKDGKTARDIAAAYGEAELYDSVSRLGKQKPGADERGASMPAFKDEMVVQVDGLVPVDPARGLRERAQKFVASRAWSTTDVHYGDQPEPEESREQGRELWSMSIGMGLDHVPATKADWFSDVSAMMAFTRGIAQEQKCHFIVEFRLSARLWYSCTQDEISDEPQTTDASEIREMLEAEIQRSVWDRRPWWRKIGWGLWVILAFLIAGSVWTWWFGSRH